MISIRDKTMLNETDARIIPPDGIDQRKREEYEMQFFDFHSRAVHFGCWNIMIDETKLALDRMFKAMENKYASDSVKLGTFKSESKRLTDTYEARAKPYAKTLNSVIRKLIAIPSNVLLEEDKCQAEQVSPENFERMKRKLDDLQNKAKRARTLNAALHQQLEIQERFEVSKDFVNNTTTVIEEKQAYPIVNNELIRLLQELDELYKQLANCGCTSSKKNRYNPPVEHLKEYNPAL